MKTEKQQRVCKQCGQDITETHWQTKFCAEKCKKKFYYWANHEEEKKKNRERKRKQRQKQKEEKKLKNI